MPFRHVPAEPFGGMPPAPTAYVRPMRVAVVNLTSGGFSGGYAKYLRELIPRLRDDARIAELLVLGPSGAKDAVDWCWPDGDAKRRRPALGERLDRWKPDLLFIPTARLYRWGGVPVVTMVRNMEPLVVPFAAPTWRERAVNVARRLEARRAARHADHVIAVSGFVAEYLREHWRVPQARMSVVPHGVHPPVDGGVQPRLAPGSLPPQTRVVLSAGSIRPARGIEDLLYALPILRRDSGHQAQLWFAGAPTPGAERYLASLKELSRALGVDDAVIWLDNLRPPELLWCFRRADIFAMTSRVEACPNLVLESLAAGAMSVSVDTPPMPEFYGDAARYYTAGNATQLATQLGSALSTPPAALFTLRAAATSRAQRYRWEDTAAATAAALSRTLSTHG